MPIPDSLDFKLSDVTLEIDSHTGEYPITLGDCVTSAEEDTANRWDPMYEGDKDRLSNFRAYGYARQFSQISIDKYTIATEVQSMETPYRDIRGSNSTYFYLAVDHQQDAEHSIFSILVYNIESNKIVCKGGRIFDGKYKEMLVVNDDLIFLVYYEKSGSSYYYRLRSLRFNKSTGVLDIRSSRNFLASNNEYNPKLAHCTRAFSTAALGKLYVTNVETSSINNKVRSYSISSTGIFGSNAEQDVDTPILSMVVANNYLITVSDTWNSGQAVKLKSYKILNEPWGYQEIEEVDQWPTSIPYDMLTPTPAGYVVANSAAWGGDGVSYYGGVPSYTDNKYRTLFHIDEGGNIIQKGNPEYYSYGGDPLENPIICNSYNSEFRCFFEYNSIFMLSAGPQIAWKDALPGVPDDYEEQKGPFFDKPAFGFPAHGYFVRVARTFAYGFWGNKVDWYFYLYKVF